MYVLAPAASTRWLNVPYNALRGDRWPSPASLAQAIDSSYIIIPMELRHTLLRRAGDSAARWSFAALATATMLTSAMALYYYVPWGQLELNMEQLLSSFGEDGLGSIPEYGELYEEEEHDDDEHIDPELLDGFKPKGADQVLNVVLTSSDPTSELCHKPMLMDLSGSKTNASSRAVSPGRKMLEDNLDGDDVQRRRSMPSILKRESQSFPTATLGNPLLLEANTPRQSKRIARHTSSTGAPHPLARLRSSESESNSSTDSLQSNSPKNSDCSGGSSSRSVVLTEPDWSPFVEIHDRARKRVVMAMIAHAMKELQSGRVSPTKKSKQLPILNALPVDPPPELGDGSEFRFERFTRSTAAAGKHWDWRRHSTSDLTELLDKDVLASLENIGKENRKEGSDSITELKTPVMESSSEVKDEGRRPETPPSCELPSSCSLPDTTSSSTAVQNDAKQGLSESSCSESTPNRIEFCFTPTKRKFELDLDALEVSTAPDALELNTCTTPHSPKLPSSPSGTPHFSRSRNDMEKFASPFTGRASVAKRRLKDKFTNRLTLSLVDT